MREQMFRDLAAAVEERVELPDLAALEERGRAVRRRRLTALAAGAASVALVAAALLASVPEQDDSAPPVDDPTDSGADLAPYPFSPDPLQAGREYALLIGNPDVPRAVTATFTPPSDAWLWWGATASRALPGDELLAIPRVPYAEVGTTMPTHVPLTQCREVPAWQALRGTPEAAARQILAVPRVRVLQQPEKDARFGSPGVHLRITVPRLCEQWNDAWLWTRNTAAGGGDPGVGTVFHDGQVLDVWIVDVGGELVVVHLSRTPGLPQSVLAEAEALLESVTLEPPPED